MEIPILSGVYVDADPRFRTLYPVNLAPVPVANGISNSYLRPGDGMVAEAVGIGVDRGGINWNDVCYRVSGSKLISVSEDNVVTVLGDVGGSTFDQHVKFDYSFDLLAIASNDNLFYWDGATLTQVTDIDLGVVVDMVWVDGYFMTTDGEFLVVTELNDPFAVNPLKYGASEIDPDPVVALLKLRNEVHALNRYTIEVFDNVGGDLFPFARIDGAQISKGCVGVHACCVFMEALAFVGSGRNEAPSIYMGASGQTVKISSNEIDTILLDYTEEQLSISLVEARNDKAHDYLYVHLPDRTLVYDATASAQLRAPIWLVMTSAITGFSQYRARSFVWAYNKWLIADPQSTALGTFSDTNGAHWGEIVRWEFGTAIVYNSGMGAVFHDLELVALTGRVDADTVISTSWSYDGIDYTADAPIATGGPGDFQKRLCWRRQGKMRNWRIQKFTGDSRAHLSFARLEARIEPLMF